MFNVGTIGVENGYLESKVSPGSDSLKAKLIFILCRSITATL